MIAMTIRGGETQARVPKLRRKTGSGDQSCKNCSNYHLYTVYGLAIALATLLPLTISFGNFQDLRILNKNLKQGSFWFGQQFICPAESPLSNCSIMTAWRLDTCLNCSAHSATATLAINHNTNFSDLNLILYITFSTSTLFWLFPNAWGIIKLMFSALRIWRW